MSLPGVAELLRPVGPGPASDSGRHASGREAHPQKITVYLSADELLDLERARLTLRTRGIGVDRGRLVREAIAVLIADLEAGIDASLIVRRLSAAAEAGPDGASVTSSPVNGASVSGAPAGAMASGALAGGALASGSPAGALAHGALGDGAAAAALASGTLAGTLADAARASGAPAGALAHGARANGASPGLQ